MNTLDTLITLWPVQYYTAQAPDRVRRVFAKTKEHQVEVVKALQKKLEAFNGVVWSLDPKEYPVWILMRARLHEYTGWVECGYWVAQNQDILTNEHQAEEDRAVSESGAGVD